MKVSDAVTEITILEKVKVVLSEGAARLKGSSDDTLMMISLSTALQCKRLVDMRLSLLNECEVSEPNWLNVIDMGGIFRPEGE